MPLPKLEITINLEVELWSKEEVLTSHILTDKDLSYPLSYSMYISHFLLKYCFHARYWDKTGLAL